MTSTSVSSSAKKRRKRAILPACLVLSFLCLSVFCPKPPNVPAAEKKASPAPPVPGVAGESPGDEQWEGFLRRLDASYRNLQSYQADFEQESETKSIRMQRKSSGTVFFSKPDRMRWSYREPEPREVYLLAEQILVYLPARNMVMKQTLGDTLPGLAPARLFMGVRELQEGFSVSPAPSAREEKGATCLRLVPRQRQGFSAEEIFLWVSEKDLLPLKSESRDMLGNVTKLFFRNGRTNAKLAADIFRFEIPEDAEVVEEMY